MGSRLRPLRPLRPLPCRARPGGHGRALPRPEALRPACDLGPRTRPAGASPAALGPGGGPGGQKC